MCLGKTAVTHTYERRSDKADRGPARGDASRDTLGLNRGSAPSSLMSFAGGGTRNLGPPGDGARSNFAARFLRGQGHTVRNPFDAALSQAGVPHEGHISKGANHGFHNDTTPRYDEAAARKPGNVRWSGSTNTCGPDARIGSAAPPATRLEGSAGTLTAFSPPMVWRPTISIRAGMWRRAKFVPLINTLSTKKTVTHPVASPPL